MRIASGIWIGGDLDWRPNFQAWKLGSWNFHFLKDRLRLSILTPRCLLSSRNGEVPYIRGQGLDVPRLGHNISGGAPVLIYETTDSGFANLAVEALREARVDAYRTGGSLPGGSTPTVCIYIRDAAAFLKANQILLKLGAVTDDPNKLPPKWVFAVLAIAAVVLAFWITAEWK